MRKTWVAWALVCSALPAWGISHVGDSGEERPQYSYEEFDAKLIGYLSLLRIEGKEEAAERGLDSLFRYRSQQAEILDRLEFTVKKGFGREQKLAIKIKDSLLTKRLANVARCVTEASVKVDAPLDESRGESIFRPSQGYISSSGRDCEEALKDFNDKLAMFEKASEPGNAYKNFESYVFPPPGSVDAAFLNCCKTSPTGPVRTDAFKFQRTLVPKTSMTIASEQQRYCEDEGGTWIRKEDRNLKVKRKVLNEVTIGEQTYYCLK